MEIRVDINGTMLHSDMAFYCARAGHQVLNFRLKQ